MEYFLIRNKEDSRKTMSILASTRKLLTIVGITPMAIENLPWNLQNKNGQMAINTIHVAIIIISFLTYNLSILVFLLFEATNFTQFSEAILFYLVSYLHLSFYSISIWKRSEIISLMNDIERTIQKSE